MLHGRITLAYHSIGKQPAMEVGSELYRVSEKAFRKQMEYVKFVRSHGHQAASIETTFDDGDITNYEVSYPILKRRGLEAYFFIIVAKVGTRGYMNWKQIKELKNAGMIIGSHGMTHRILTTLNEKEIEHEVKESKKILEDNLEGSIDYFSLPRGLYNKKTIDKAREVGYKRVFTSNPHDDDGFKIGRIAVRSDWDLDYFKKVINKGFSLKDKLITTAKNSARGILGDKNYDKIRTKILLW